MSGVAFPPEPWDLVGQGYVTLWAVPVRSLPALPAGTRPLTLFGRAVVATAFVDYRPGGVLAYRELLATVLVRAGRRVGVSITHIWVDSLPSRAGARAMWGIPKDIAGFGFTQGPVFTGSAETQEQRIAQAAFAPVLRALPLPMRGSIVQALRGELARTPIRVRGPVQPARAGWRFDGDGPLAWLRGRRAIASLTTTGFRMRFGPRA